MKCPNQLCRASLNHVDVEISMAATAEVNLDGTLTVNPVSESLNSVKCPICGEEIEWLLNESAWDYA